MKAIKFIAIFILATCGWAVAYSVYLGLVSLIRWGFA